MAGPSSAQVHNIHNAVAQSDDEAGQYDRVSMQVAGNAKGIAAATISVVILGNSVSFMSCAGLFVTILGVATYSHFKRRNQVLQSSNSGTESGMHHERVADTACTATHAKVRTSGPCNNHCQGVTKPGSALGLLTRVHDPRECDDQIRGRCPMGMDRCTIFLSLSLDPSASFKFEVIHVAMAWLCRTHRDVRRLAMALRFTTCTAMLAIGSPVLLHVLRTQGRTCTKMLYRFERGGYSRSDGFAQSLPQHIPPGSRRWKSSNWIAHGKPALGRGFWCGGMPEQRSGAALHEAAMHDQQRDPEHKVESASCSMS